MEQINITSAQYNVDSLSGDTYSIQVTINGVSWSVPLDPENTTYAEILRQVESGTLVIQEADNGAE